MDHTGVYEAFDVTWQGPGLVEQWLRHNNIGKDDSQAQDARIALAGDVQNPSGMIFHMDEAAFVRVLSEQMPSGPGSEVYAGVEEARAVYHRMRSEALQRINDARIKRPGFRFVLPRFPALHNIEIPAMPRDWHWNWRLPRLVPRRCKAFFLFTLSITALILSQFTFVAMFEELGMFSSLVMIPFSIAALLATLCCGAFLLTSVLVLGPD